MGEEFFDGRLEFPIRHVFLGQKAAAACVGLDRAWAPAKLLRKSGVLRITRTSFRMNIDRARLWKRFNAGEAIIGKKNSAVFARDECAQAVTARGSVGGHLCLRGESINRRTEGSADRFGDFGWNGHDANGQHELFLTSFFRCRAARASSGRKGLWSVTTFRFYPVWAFKFAKELQKIKPNHKTRKEPLISQRPGLCLVTASETAVVTSCSYR